MTNDAATNRPSNPSWNKSSHQVLLSWFESPDDAQLALADLMDQGLSEQDFTLLRLEPEGDGRLKDPLAHVVAPFVTRESGLSDETEGSADRESDVGAGIETTTPDDNISAPQDSDDSETLAQDLSYPAEGHSFGDEEARDIETAANTGFFKTTRPTRPAWRGAETAVDEIDLPGLGALVGEGSFGGQLMDRVFKEHDTSLAWLAARINKRAGETGVAIQQHGAMLAIDVNAMSPDPERIEDVLMTRSARWVRRL